MYLPAESPIGIMFSRHDRSGTMTAAHREHLDSQSNLDQVAAKKRRESIVAPDLLHKLRVIDTICCILLLCYSFYIFKHLEIVPDKLLQN
jgi:hypothetical protein